jgi:hypothetical protein
MRSERWCVMVGVWGLAALFACATASADIVNVDTSTRLFYDDLESAASVSHAAYPDASGDYDPVGAGWTSLIEDSAGANIQATDVSAAQGRKSLRIGRGSTYTTCPWAGIGFAGTRDQLRVTEMMNISGAMQIWFSSESGGTCAALKTSGDGTVQAYSTDFPDSWGTVSGLTYTPGTWQKWQIDFCHAKSGLFSVSIDGGTPVTGIAYQSTAAVTEIGFSNGNAVSDNYFLIDEVQVPEPSALVLIFLGVISLLAYAWRKHK